MSIIVKHYNNTLNSIITNTYFLSSGNWKKIIVFVILFITNSKAIQCQNADVDSLKRELALATNDSVKCFILSNLSFYTELPDNKKRIDDCQKLFKQKFLKSTTSAQKKYYGNLLAIAYKNLANYFINNDFSNDSIVPFLNESILLLSKYDPDNLISETYVDLGYYYYRKPDFQKALFYYTQALNIARKNKSLFNEAQALNDIACLYQETDDLHLALQYYKECISKLPVDGHERECGTVYYNIGNIYSEKQMNDTALAFFKKALVLCKLTNDEGMIVNTLTSISKCYIRLEKYTLALDYAEQAQKISETNHHKYEQALTNLSLAEVWAKLENNKKAIVFGESAYRLAKEIEQRDLYRPIIFQLSTIYKNNKNYEKALIYSDLFHELNDSINNNNNRKALLRSQYEVEYTKKAITDSLKTAKDKEIMLLQLQSQKKQKQYLYVIIALVLLFGLFVFYRLRESNKQKRIIAATNQQLEVVNKDLGRQHTLNQKIFSVISHDFRGPILSLKLLFESFHKKNKDEALNTYVNEVNHEMTNVNDILNNLLNWARTELHIKDFDKTNSNVLTIYNSTINEFEQKLKSKHLTVNTIISNDSSIELPPDIVRITLRNLLSNAVKFSFENNRIDIVFDKKTGSLSVTDFGKGMNDELKNKLFKKEVDTELGTHNEEGFGMGLYILHELLHKYNYKIAVESRVNKGSTFTISRI